jgi:hypothetical protein
MCSGDNCSGLRYYHAMNLVYRHKSGGTLWQGDRNDVEALATNHDKRINTIVLCAIEFQPDIRSKRYEVLKHGFDDNPWMRESEAQQVKDIADQASNRLARRVRNGRGVLSTCHAGLNRSGLVSALTMMKAEGMEPDEAIRLIRQARGPDALHNQCFINIIRWMKHRSGPLSPWMEWQATGEGRLSRSAMVETTTEEIRRAIHEIERKSSGNAMLPATDSEI